MGGKGGEPAQTTGLTDGQSEGERLVGTADGDRARLRHHGRGDRDAGAESGRAVQPVHRGLRSSTFQLNLAL